LGGLPAIFFGDFAQLPPIGDTPLYSTKEGRGRRAALAAEGRTVFESFTQSVTLSRVFRQAGNDPEQEAFRDALLRLRTYSSTEADYNLFQTRFWDNLTPEEHTEFDDAQHLLPTHAAVHELNLQQLAAIGNPVVQCKAKHNTPAARKASDEDAEGLETEILLAEGARVMLTRNLWTSKGGAFQNSRLLLSQHSSRTGQWMSRCCEENMLQPNI